MATSQKPFPNLLAGTRFSVKFLITTRFHQLFFAGEKFAANACGRSKMIKYLFGHGHKVYRNETRWFSSGNGSEKATINAGSWNSGQFNQLYNHLSIDNRLFHHPGQWMRLSVISPYMAVYGEIRPVFVPYFIVIQVTVIRTVYGRIDAVLFGQGTHSDMTEGLTAGGHNDLAQLVIEKKEQTMMEIHIIESLIKYININCQENDNSGGIPCQNLDVSENSQMRDATDTSAPSMDRKPMVSSDNIIERWRLLIISEEY